MMTITRRMRVHAGLETVWTILMECAANPNWSIPEVDEWRVLERAEETIVRELMVSETPIEERLTFDRCGKTIHREFLDHLGFEGRITITAVYCSVQPPAETVDLRYCLEWEPKLLQADGWIDEKEESQMLLLVTLQRQEQRQVKEMAEALERIS